MCAVEKDDKLAFTPFLYRGLLDRLLQNRNLIPRVLLVGGPGLGKTTILKLFLKEAAENDEAILIDDLDRDFQSKIENYPGTLAPSSDRWVVASVRDPQRLIESGELGATLVRTFESIHLAPSSGTDPEEALEQVHQRFSQEKADQIEQLDDEILRIWRQAIVKTSEGHPALLGAASDSLLRLWSFFPEVSLHEQMLLEEVSSRRDVEEYLEVALNNTAMSLVSPILDDLVQQGNTYLINQIKALAAGKEWDGEASDRRQLLATGLVTSLKGGRLKPLCRLFRNAVQQHKAVKDSLATKRAATTPRSYRQNVVWYREETGPEQGTLHLRNDQNFHRIVYFSGGTWKLLSRLARENGGIVPIDELQVDLELPSESAVRSVIQRLIRELREAQITNLIVNVRGEGYSLPMEPQVEVLEEPPKVSES